MTFYEKAEKKAGDRLRALLEKPLPASEDEIGVVGLFDPWDAFDGIVGAYDSEIDAMAIATLKSIVNRTTFNIQAEQHGLFVQFFLHILAGHNYVSYGTSPRGAFPTQYTRHHFPKWIEKWEAWSAISWPES